MAYLHTMDHGVGFDDEYEIGAFNEVDARKHAIELALNLGADYLVQCDADEWYSPRMYDYIRAMKEPIALSIPELKWFAPDRYKKGPYHLRCVPSDPPPEVRYNENWVKLCADSQSRSNASLHCGITTEVEVVSLDRLWHNHVHDFLGAKRSPVLPRGLTGYEVDPDMLRRGRWPREYLKMASEVPKRDPEAKVNAGWERINDEKKAAHFILDKDDSYNGHLHADDDLLSRFIPLGSEMRVLDMCCGLGRNTIWINEARPYCETWGYDLPNMTQLAKDYTRRHLGADHEIRYVGSWSELQKHDFDAVFATISFQHVLPKYLDKYYAFLAKTLSRSSYGRLLVHGRDWSDHNEREIVWDRLQRHFEVDEEHPLSKGFKRTEFTKEYKSGDHHTAVFKPCKSGINVSMSKPNESANPLPDSDKHPMDFVITGCQRSGTKFASIVLGTAGASCSHEIIFSGNLPCHFLQDMRSICKMRNHGIWGESSWLAVPFLKNLPENTKIIHQTRNPLSVIKSIMGIRFFDQNNKWKVFVMQWEPELNKISSSIEKSMLYWLKWNEAIEESGRVTLSQRLEDFNLATTCIHIGLDIDTNRALAIIDQAGKYINHRRIDETITWDLLPCGEIKTRIEEKATQYGYAMG